ncbi:MAG TPA: T9SS type A sorting domain-containing protein, partial [Bacteroidia bacterium]|nr:T9SS type A sorting domain-containing protein [Bacteroidia bacterium]
KVGNIYIADIQNSRIREVVASSGIINTIAGTGVSGYSGDGGLATAAELTSPDGIAINSFGNVYLADAGPNIIREIVGPAGIQEIKSSIANVAVYPNPNNGVFTIQLSRVSEKSSVEIYNMLREEVFIQSFNSTNTMVDISNKVAGIYMYRVLTETGLLISEGKIVKE